MRNDTRHLYADPRDAAIIARLDPDRLSACGIGVDDGFILTITPPKEGQIIRCTYIPPRELTAEEMAEIHKQAQELGSSF